MQSKYRAAIVMASLIITSGTGTSWGAAPPPVSSAVSDDNFNTAGGTNALDSAGAGAFNNTAFGFNALTNDSSGDNNSAFGVSALESNTTGNNNTGCGFRALFSNTSGGANTAPA